MSDFQPVGFTYGLCDPSSEKEKQNTVLNSSAPPGGSAKAADEISLSVLYCEAEDSVVKITTQRDGNRC